MENMLFIVNINVRNVIININKCNAKICFLPDVMWKAFQFCENSTFRA